MTKMKPRESQDVEYKSSWHDKYLEWICGFANAQGAVMYFGVNDDHEGCHRDRSLTSTRAMEQGTETL